MRSVQCADRSRRQLVALIVKLYRKAYKNPKKYGIWAPKGGNYKRFTMLKKSIDIS